MVHVADIIQTGDDVPSKILAEHLVGLGLGYKRGQFHRIVPVRNPEQDAVVAFHNVPDLQESGRRKESSVIVVRRISQKIVVRVYIFAGIQKANLVDIAQIAEYLYGLPYLNLPSVESDVVLDYLPHSVFQQLDIFFAKGRIVLFLYVAVEST